MQHQARAEWNEDDVAAPDLTTKRRDEHWVRVTDSGVHALARSRNPELSAGAYGVADEARCVRRGQLQ